MHNFNEMYKFKKRLFRIETGICKKKKNNLVVGKLDSIFANGNLLNPAKRNVLDLKNETCKNREKRNVLKISHTRHFKTTKKQSKTGCFYSF